MIELIIDVGNTYVEELIHEKLFEWYRMLMKGSREITVGAWHTQEAPMQGVSGSIGKENIHY